MEGNPIVEAWFQNQEIKHNQELEDKRIGDAVELEKYEKAELDAYEKMENGENIQTDKRDGWLPF